jgi:hypothetical protein
MRKVPQKRRNSRTVIFDIKTNIMVLYDGNLGKFHQKFQRAVCLHHLECRELEYVGSR